MQTIPENIGQFYLGTETHPEQRPLLYDAADLTTHAVIIGMTGSGKTGLGITLLEEAALDNIPVIAVDPKGDLGNLALNFPRLQAEDFLPYADPAALAQTGETPADWAQKTAARWQEGIEKSGLSRDRLALLQAGNTVRLYTPGSDTGIPLALLGDLPAPEEALRQDREAYGELLDATAAGLLALLKQEHDPLAPPHIFLTRLLAHHWDNGQTLTLTDLITGITRPPFSQIGILPVAQVFPDKARQNLALAFNNLLAAPSFSAWRNGQPLDCEALFYDRERKAQTSVLNIAHLSDSERMYFVTLLLSKLIAWMRRQQGTQTLRAILYMDEIAGYLPPNANPASKAGFLTLLKQARAFGLGLVLSSQNPIDLDYKALSNAGTWFVGRLQTAQDRARIREGLLSAGGEGIGAGELDEWFDRLGKRHFLLKNIHEDSPCIFTTRWAMSYLAGPLNKQQIAAITAADKGNAAAAAEAPPTADENRAALLPPGIAVRYLPGPGNSGNTHYYPTLLAVADIYYQDTRSGIRNSHELLLNAAIGEDGSIDWKNAETLAVNRDQLQSAPQEPAVHHPAPAPVQEAKNWTQWEKTLKTALRQFATLDVYYAPDLKIHSEPGESEAAFRNRLIPAAHEKRDSELIRLRQSYAGKQLRLSQRQISAQQAVSRESSQAGSGLLDAGIAVGGALLGAFMGRKTLSQTNINRAAGAIRKVGKIGKERQDLAAAQEKAALVEAEIAELENALRAELAAVENRYRTENLTLEKKTVNAKASDINVSALMLLYRTADT